MGVELLPSRILEMYEVHEWGHACAILKSDFPDEWNDILCVLNEFKLKKEYIVSRGGRKSPIASSLDKNFYRLGWEEKQFQTQMVIDEQVYNTPTHKIDCFKNKIGVEIEWNNKDPFFDRDLNNFRLLYDRRAISVGVIITRCDELQQIFVDLGKGSSYGASTTHMKKLIPRIDGGGAGGCPILVFGISSRLYEE